MDILKDMNSKSSQFKQGFMFGLGYLTAFGISITMIMLGGWVKACTDDIKELKQQKVDECKYEEVENHGILLEGMLKMKKDIPENAVSNDTKSNDEQRQEVQEHMDSKECCDECCCEIHWGVCGCDEYLYEERCDVCSCENCCDDYH